MEGLSRKIYLELAAPTEEDAASAQERILRALPPSLAGAALDLRVLRKLEPLCREANWKVTLSLAWNGLQYRGVELEAGDTTGKHWGIALDLGSTTVAGAAVDCETGKVLARDSVFSRQIAFGDDILTRIFYCKDHPEHLEELRRATVDTINEVIGHLARSLGADGAAFPSVVLAGNTAMVHFLLGLDPFCVFSAPYAVRADRPGFFRAGELGILTEGYVYCYPCRANYLGGDIVSGVVASGMHSRQEISVFLDIGTNGELVVGGRDFLLCGAGAAGPALEGGVVKTGMKAADGAVSRVRIENGDFVLETIGGGEPRGICGSGIVDMLAELFLHGWLDFRGKLLPEASPKIYRREGELCVEYAPGLYFYQSDVEEFLKTKAAAATMVDYILNISGIPMEEISRFYVAGAFGTHIDKESAVTIGLYPDMDRERIVSLGNASLEGARLLLLNRGILKEIDEILDVMEYVQFGAVEDFLEIMTAASAIPHMDMRRYPSVAEKLRQIGRARASAGEAAARGAGT